MTTVPTEEYEFCLERGYRNLIGCTALMMAWRANNGGSLENVVVVFKGPTPGITSVNEWPKSS